MKIGIVGAGATGLAAAYEICKQGHRAVVYEGSPFTGGQASTFEVGGTPVERGYHHWFTSDRDIVDLVDEIGLGDRVEWINSRVGTLVGDKIYKFVSPVDLLRFTPMSLTDRFRFGLLTLYLQHQGDYSKYENITADEWLRMHSGKTAYESFWRPMLRGKFGEQHYREVSMAWIWGKVQTRTKSRGLNKFRETLGYPIGGFGAIFDHLAEQVHILGGQVLTSCPVKSIDVDNNFTTGLTVTREGRDHFEPFDAVLATTPSYILPRLAPELPESYVSQLLSTKYMAAVLLVLVLDRPITDMYWVNVADREIPFIAVIEHTNMVGPEHYGGNHIVYLSNYLTTEDPLYKLTKEELLHTYLPDLRKLNPDFQECWIREVHHHRIGAAQPIVGTGYGEKIPAHRTPIERLYLGNTSQIYPEDRGTNYSVRMGRILANKIIQDVLTLGR